MRENTQEHLLTIAISTRALFNLEVEHEIFIQQGAKAYVDYQIEREEEILEPGPAFELVQSFLNLNHLPGHEKMIRIIIMSKNSADASLRIFHSIEQYQMDITQAVLTTGGTIAPYLSAFHSDLYLSADEEDVRAALQMGIAAGLVCCHSTEQGQEKGARLDTEMKAELNCKIRIAFDGDAVLFSDEAEQIFQTQGVEAFCKNEKAKARTPLPQGPFANFLRTISKIQEMYSSEESPIKTALVTARSAPAHERVIRTLRNWGVRIDEAFFLGGLDKSEVLEAFGADIFFDDNEAYTSKAAKVVLSARVPYGINDTEKVG